MLRNVVITCCLWQLTVSSRNSLLLRPREQASSLTRCSGRGDAEQKAAGFIRSRCTDQAEHPEQVGFGEAAGATRIDIPKSPARAFSLSVETNWERLRRVLLLIFLCGQFYLSGNSMQNLPPGKSTH